MGKEEYQKWKDGLKVMKAKTTKTSIEIKVDLEDEKKCHITCTGYREGGRGK